MFSSIVVGTDGTSTSREALEKAADLASLTGAVLHVVQAFKPPTQSLGLMAGADTLALSAAAASDGDVAAAIEADLSARAAELERKGVTTKTYCCPTSSAAAAILDVATHQQADLVVVGNKGVKGARRILGSVPNAVVRESPCAVLVVHTT